MGDRDPARVVIRRAVVADAPACARFHIASWREAYAGMLADEVLERLAAGLDGRVAAWRSMIAAGHPRWVALTQEGAVAAFVGFGTGRDPDLVTLREVHAFYVGKSWWGSGLADRLMAEIVGDAEVYLWVLKLNYRAQSFYRRHGFRMDGAERVLTRLQTHELRMVRRGAEPPR